MEKVHIHQITIIAFFAIIGFTVAFFTWGAVRNDTPVVTVASISKDYVADQDPVPDFPSIKLPPLTYTHGENTMGFFLAQRPLPTKP